MENKYSIHKIAWHPEKLASIRDGKITAPIYVRIKPTNVCNHGCHFCCYSSQTKKPKVEKQKTMMHRDIDHRSRLTREELLSLLRELSAMGTKCVTFSGGGEPLMHHDIVDAMELTKELGMDLSLITNGQLLSGSRAKSLHDAAWVRVSIDYSNKDQMMAFRGVQENAFSSVIENMKRFIAERNRCDLTVNYIVTANNYASIGEAVELLSFVDNIRFSPMWADKQWDYHAPFFKQAKEAIQKAKLKHGDKVFDGYNIASEPLKRQIPQCYWWQINPVVGADGGIYACHNQAYSKNGYIGSIKDGGFSVAWAKALEKMNGFNACEKCRCQCANEKKNLLIHEIIGASSDNFV